MVKCAALTELTNSQIECFSEIIYRTAGIRTSAAKKTLLSNRIRRRVKELELESFDAYLKLLRSQKPDSAEWKCFLQEITTHETYLFRDQSHWDWLRTEFIPQFTQAHKGLHTLRIWSAACSSGDEPYTIAACLAEEMQKLGGCKIEIVATDIGVDSLKQAQNGVFNERSMHLVPKAIAAKHFTLESPGRYKAKDHLRELISFRHHNLMHPLPGKHFDLVILKNVLIYFDSESKRQVVRNVDRVLNTGGYLITGPAEGITDCLQSYQRVKVWLHRKTRTS
jgi:chemotaxis protein methyltransferase CheR